MVIASDEKLSVSQAIGYMLKVIKTGNDITNFKGQFNAIKHGDYDCFFKMIKEPQPELLIQWKEGVIKNENFSQESGDCDVAMLVAIEPSVIKFHNECCNYYGNIIDTDISNLIFCKCAAFEKSCRETPASARRRSMPSLPPSTRRAPWWLSRR